MPEFQRKGYSKLLPDFSLEKAKDCENAVCMEGNILFYGKSGFVTADSFGIRYHSMPEGEKADFFLCKELKKESLSGITGEYAPPSGYFVDGKKAEEFDKSFPPKQKLKLPTQLFLKE